MVNINIKVGGRSILEWSFGVCMYWLVCIIYIMSDEAGGVFYRVCAQILDRVTGAIIEFQVVTFLAIHNPLFLFILIPILY